MNRRDFVLKSCTGCLSGVMITTLITSCSATKTTKSKLGTDGLSVSLKDFILKKGGKTAYRDYIVIYNEQLLFPIYVYRHSEAQYSALWMRCTHQGNELQASGDTLQCQAHGSEFNKMGELINGPADVNLRNFPVTIQHEMLFIDLRKPQMTSNNSSPQ